MARTGAAAVIIGNEVLSAKVVDTNGVLLIQRLRECGIPLRSLTIVPDEIDAIVEAVASARAKAQYVFTSGGIGPTHDDVTVRAVALALGREVERLPEVEALIRQHYGDKLRPEAMRLADVPRGATLLRPANSWYPVITVEGMFLLPGVPPLFKLQLETVLATLEKKPVYLRNLYLLEPESVIANALDTVALAMPDVAIGSYPLFGKDTEYKVKVTVEAESAERMNRAVDELKQRIPKEALLRED